MRMSLAIVVATVALASVAARLDGAHAAVASATKVCTPQIKNGPKASYWSSVSGIKVKNGTTWTVLATGVDCGKAIGYSKTFLGMGSKKQGPWAKAKLGAPLPLKGFTCVKMIDASYDGMGKSSGGGLCHVGSTPGASPFSPDTFAFRDTGPYSVAQIKQFFHLS